MRIIILAMLVAGLFHSSFGQVIYPNHYIKNYLKLLDLENENFESGITLHPSIISAYAPDSSLKNDIWDGKFEYLNLDNKRIQVLDPSWSASFNSKYPRGYNDGAQWQGKGFNSALNFGVTGRIGILHYTFAPVVYMAQNKAYTIVENSAARNEFAYPFAHNIDWVQRYGNEPLYAFHPGQSEVRLVYKKATIGVSTQNMTWGPSQFNPILMSVNAGGFPHIDLGTNAPVNTSIGDVEFKSYWGILKESKYFDSDDSNNDRYVTGFVLGYRPKFIKGLSLGFNRVLYQRSKDFDFKDVFSGFSEFFSGSDEELDGRLVNDAYDQMGSIMVRWLFEEARFETYVEFARNDFSGGITDFLLQPEHTRAYTLGFIKTGKIQDNTIKFVYEHTNMGNSRTKLTRPTPTYYIHHIVPQGYTNLGQILGAGIGPGSNSDQIQLNYYTPNGLLGFEVQRIRFNDDYFFSKYAGVEGPPHDVEYTFGFNYLKFMDKVTINLGVDYSVRTNWQYLKGKNVGNLYTYFSITRRLNHN